MQETALAGQLDVAQHTFAAPLLPPPSHASVQQPCPASSSSNPALQQQPSSYAAQQLQLPPGSSPAPQGSEAPSSSGPALQRPSSHSNPLLRRPPSGHMQDQRPRGHMQEAAPAGQHDVAPPDLPASREHPFAFPRPGPQGSDPALRRSSSSSYPALRWPPSGSDAALQQQPFAAPLQQLPPSHADLELQLPPGSDPALRRPPPLQNPVAGPLPGAQGEEVFSFDDPRMRNSEGVSEGGKHPNFSAVTEK